jgi:hypothetical protein
VRAVRLALSEPELSRLSHQSQALLMKNEQAERVSNKREKS